MSRYDHLNSLTGTRRSETLEPFTPLTPEEFEGLTEREDLKTMNRDILDRMWLKPVQRILQWEYMIDQRHYSTGTIPTLAELTEDFKTAAVICVEKFSNNQDDVKGPASVQGASQIFDMSIPRRAAIMLERYDNPGGRVVRS